MQAIAEKLSYVKRTDPLRDYVKPVPVTEKTVKKPLASPDNRVAGIDNPCAGASKIRRKPFPDVVPSKRSEKSADYPGSGSCDLRRRGAVRGHADVASSLEESARKIRGGRQKAVVMDH
jgi:hypothetical protein